MATSSEESETPFFRLLTEEIIKQGCVSISPKSEEDGEATETNNVSGISIPDETLEDGQRLPKCRRKKFQPETMGCVPMAEIDPSYKNEQSFVAFGKNGTISRYSAKKALLLLEPLNPLRKGAIFLSTNWAFKAFIVAVIIANVILLSDSKSHEGFDYACTAIYIFELLLKIVSRGFILDKFTALRNPWTWLDIVVILSSLIRPFGLSSVLQWLRVLKIIPLVGEIHRSYNMMKESFKRLSGALFLILFVTFFFGILGLQIYMGILTQKCVKNMEENISSSLPYETQNQLWSDHVSNHTNWYKRSDTDPNYFLCGNSSSSRMCPEGYTCLQGFGRSIDYGYTSFDSIFWASMQSSRIIIQDFIEAVLLATIQVAGIWQVVFYILISLFGTYGLGSFAYALIGSSVFKRLQEKEQLETDSNQCKSTSNGSEAPTDELNGGNGQLREGNRNKLSTWCNSIVTSYAFEIFITCVIILDIILLPQHYNLSKYESPEYENWARYFILFRAIWFIYLGEFILKLIAQGCQGYFTKGLNILDFVILLSFFVHFSNELIPDLNLGHALWLCHPIRIFKILSRWTTLQLVFKIIRDSIKQLWGLILLSIIAMVFFAFIGNDQFMDNYSDNNTKLFPAGKTPRFNFVDFPHSLMVVIRSWGFKESIELLWDCMLVSGPQCLLYFSIVPLTGSLLIITMTIGVVFVTVKTLKALELEESENAKSKSTLSKMWTVCCSPCTWLKGKLGTQQVYNVQTEEIPMKPGNEEGKDSKPLPVETLPSVKKYRRTMQDCAESRTLRWISILIILITSVILTFQTIRTYEATTTVFVTNSVFTVFFAIVLLYKLVSFGPKSCFKSSGWIFDFIMILGTILHLSLNVKIFATLIPFMLVSRIERLEVVLKGILKELRFLRKYILAGLFIWFYFVLWGMSSFSYGFHKCIDPLDDSRPDTRIIKDKTECMANNYTWVNSEYNFDSVSSSFLTWGLISTRTGWIPVLFDAVDSRGLDMQPRQEYAISRFGIILMFIVFGLFFVFSIIFGVIYYHLKQEKVCPKSLNTRELFFTQDQKVEYESNTNGEVGVIIPRPENKTRGKIYDLITCVEFQALVMTAIIIDNVALALDAYNIANSKERIIESVRTFIFLFYTLEMVLKIVAVGKAYFKSCWNLLDFSIVVTSTLGLILSDILGKYFISPFLLRMFRLLRLFQFKPFMFRAKTLQIYLNALSKVKPALMNILSFQVVLMFSFCIFGMLVFENAKVRNPEADVNFHTFGSSVVALYLLSTFNGVDTVLHPLITEYDCDMPNPEENLPGDCGNAPIGIFFVFSYLIASFLVFLNLYFVFIMEIVSQLEINVEIQTSCQNGKQEYQLVVEQVDEKKEGKGENEKEILNSNEEEYKEPSEIIEIGNGHGQVE